MESEGLYRYEHRDEQKAFVVVGPGRENMGGTYTKKEASIAARFANLAYAEGRKAERERCAQIADDEAIEHQDGDESYMCGAVEEIAKRIRGGQDAK
jgi:hypothetical protein